MATNAKNVPFAVAPTPTVLKPQEVITKNEGTVLMYFPKRVVLMTDARQQVEFKEGHNHVPAHLANHNWLARNGAKVVSAATTLVESTQQQVAAKEAKEEANVSEAAGAVKKPKP